MSLLNTTAIAPPFMDVLTSGICSIAIPYRISLYNYLVTVYLLYLPWIIWFLQAIFQLATTTSSPPLLSPPSDADEQEDYIQLGSRTSTMLQRLSYVVWQWLPWAFGETLGEEKAWRLYTRMVYIYLIVNLSEWLVVSPLTMRCLGLKWFLS